VGRDSSVSIATRYGPDGPGIEFQWGGGGGYFPHPSRLALGLIEPPPRAKGTGSPSRGVKRTERGVDHPPTSSAEVKESVELYHYSTYGLSRPVLG
jgi:hypothetical protein